MQTSYQIVAISVLISAGCAMPAPQDAAAQAVDVEQQPAAQAPAAEPAGEPAPSSPATIREPATAPVRESADTLVKPAAAPAPPAATTPPKPQSAKSGPPAAKPPVASAPPAAQQQAPAKSQPSAPAEPQPAPPLALATLEQRLKDTNAIGVFTKLALKNQVDDLLSQFRARHDGSSKTPLAQLRQTYDQLLAKVHDLLKNGDPALATAILNSREAIWLVLADPVRFAKL